MSVASSRTKPCPYCGGTGRLPDDSWDCVDCRGSGLRCILCGLAPAECDCGESRFDDDVRREAREGGQPY